MTKPSLKPLPRLLTDEDAERFVAEADLTEYDLSGMVPVSELLKQFELQAKSASIHLRLPQGQLDQIKAEAQKRGIPYQRFMRDLMRRGMGTLEHP
jgi:predicted DNA binding CopG/RHH family protein